METNIASNDCPTDMISNIPHNVSFKVSDYKNPFRKSKQVPVGGFAFDNVMIQYEESRDELANHQIFRNHIFSFSVGF